MNKKNGFSMIEVLVASTIMITIMLMLGMLFQQTSQAWRTGRQRAEALLVARTFFGILQRDVSNAIDVNTLPTVMQEALQNAAGGLPNLQQSFSPSQIQFFTLTGTGFDNKNAEQNKQGNRALRSLTHVSYSTGGSRTETLLLPSPSADGGFEMSPSNNDRQTNLLSIRPGNVTFDVQAFTMYYLNGNSGGLPTYIMVQATTGASTNRWEIGAGSSGPDREWDTEDDIKTWTESN